MYNSSPIELSVIIPCWNIAPWLPRCLEEVFAALPDRAEVIAVDDGSQDETLEILENFAARHKELKIFSQQNFGVSAARNRALDAAGGEFIFFVDPDDGVEPGFFTEMLERMKSKNADYCICAFKIPSSSRLTATESMQKSPSRPAFFTISFKINSAMGLRQMLPWQTNRILCIGFPRFPLGLL